MPTEHPTSPAGADLPEADVETYRPRNLTVEQVRSFGAIGNLNEGIETRTNGVSTRLLAWPGIGFPNQGLHVLTLRPGDESQTYTYGTAEEALFCIRGRGEVFLRGRWVDIEAGDVAYYPEGVAHALRNPASNEKDFVLVTQITPPQFQLYTDGGYYDQEKRAFDFDLIAAAQKGARPGNISTETELRYNESHTELRSWNLPNDEIRRGGALFNIFVGAEFTGIAVPMRLVLFPGFGTRTAGLHLGFVAADAESDIHSHPISEDCVITHTGRNWAYIDGKRVKLQALDVAMATVMAKHGGVTGEGPVEDSLMTGFGAPAQQDLYLNTTYYQNGEYVRPDSTKLDIEALKKSPSSDPPAC